MLLHILYVLTPVAVAAGLIVWRRRIQTWRPFLPLIGGTGVAMALALGSYFWVFQNSRTCGGFGDPGCRLNANQGGLTALALLLAAAAIWTTVVTRELDRRRADSLLTRRAAAALYGALQDTHHNLIHIAMCFDDERRLRGLPQVSIASLDMLFVPDVRMHLDEKLIEIAGAICRNVEFMGYGWDDKYETKPPFTAFVGNSLELLCLALKLHPGWTPPELRENSMRDLRTVATGDAEAEFWYGTSDLRPAMLAHMRAEDWIAVVWWDDAKPKGLRVYEIGSRFVDLSISHGSH